MAKTKYKPNFPERAKEYAKKGLIEAQIAKNLGIGVTTFNKYKKEYPEFYEALKNGKIGPDDEVENALFKRALGYEYEEVKTEYLTTGNVRRTVYTRKMAPDVTAQIFWLKNRRPDRWRDKIEHEHKVEVTGFDVKRIESNEKNS